MPDLSDALAQSQRALAGDKLENVSILILNTIHASHGVRVLKGTRRALAEYLQDENLARQIIDFNRLPV